MDATDKPLIDRVKKTRRVLTRRRLRSPQTLPLLPSRHHFAMDHSPNYRMHRATGSQKRCRKRGPSRSCAATARKRARTRRGQSGARAATNLGGGVAGGRAQRPGTLNFPAGARPSPRPRSQLPRSHQICLDQDRQSCRRLTDAPRHSTTPAVLGPGRIGECVLETERRVSHDLA